ncbi:MAG: oligosaccharide flippase family protein [Erythrobacter sp.]|nr:oligosaccharide flippase family protein [Erythrobacter sp.]
MIRRALTNTGWLLGARGVNAVLSLVYLALATRALGVDRFGLFVFAFSFAQVMVGMASFQTWQVIIRWGQDDEGRKTATGFALALDLVTLVVGLTVGSLVLGFAGEWLILSDKARIPAFLFTVVSLLSIRSTPTGLLRLHDRYDLAAYADATTSIVRAIGAVVAILVKPGLQSFLIVWSLAELATAGAYWYFALRTEKIHVERISLTRLPRERRAAGEKPWSFVIGTSLSGVLAVASKQFLVLLVGVWGGAALAGIYRVASQLGEGLLKLAQALLRATYPELVREPDKARQIAGRMALIAMVTGVAVVVLALLLGHWVILVVAGSAFVAAYIPMVILSAAAAMELAGASLEALLVARGHALTNFLIRATPAVIGLASLPWLIDAFGVAGAALVVLTTSTVSVTGFVLMAQRTHPVPGENALAK